MGTNRRLARAAVGVLALAGLALAGCGSDEKSSGTTAAAVTTTAAAAGADGSGITIKDFQFQIPSGLEAGETVTVTNEDSAAHTFTDQQGSFSVAAQPGTPADFTVPAAGTYTVVCNIHQGMQGTLTVG